MKKISKTVFWLLLALLAILLIGLVVWYLLSLRGKDSTKQGGSGSKPMTPGEELRMEPGMEPDDYVPDPEDVSNEKYDLEIPADKITVVDVYNIIRNNIEGDDEFHRFLTAQAMHETGVFTSKLLKEHNNLFGMRFPRLRDTTAQFETPNNYASYDSLEDSVKDLGMWFDYNKLPRKWDNGISGFVSDIKKKGYFTDSWMNYYNAVRRHYLKLNTVLQ